MSNRQSTDNMGDNNAERTTNLGIPHKPRACNYLAIYQVKTPRLEARTLDAEDEQFIKSQLKSIICDTTSKQLKSLLTADVRNRIVQLGLQREPLTDPEQILQRL
eukprot:1238893-Pleurochrysis_carterae.AAC.1